MVEQTSAGDIVEPIAAEATRIEVDATYTYKAHFNAADRWSSVHLWLGIPSALCAALAGASAWKNFPDAAGALALLSAGLTAVLTFLSPQGRHAAHLQAGGRFLALRNEARILRDIELRSAVLPTDMVARVKDLSSRYAETNSSGPLIPQSAYRKAREGMAAGEHLYSQTQGAQPTTDNKAT